MSSTHAFLGRIELTPGFQPRPDLSHVLFDFDGTLSLIREGWPEVMIPLFVEKLPRLAGDTESSLRQLARDDIMRLNGKQTIYQMIQLAERIAERGGEPEDPLAYKQEYLARLEARIWKRKEGLRRDGPQSDRWLVRGARSVLEGLQTRGVPLYLASGTDERFVLEEARLLDLERYFGPRIFGAQDDYRSFSKKLVIERILRDNAIPGGRLLAFGDGYVEIENTKAAGGLAVGVASDEARKGSGLMDEWKRTRLLGVGADLVIPDFADAGPLLDLLFPS